MRFAAFIFIFSASSMAFAQNYTHRLARAKSAGEVRDIQTRFEQLQVAQRACRLQVSSKSVPFACYEVLSLEIAWGMHQSSSRKRLSEKLDAMCTEAAQKFLVPRKIPNGVSSKCRAEILAANRILTYREDRPAWSEN